MKIMVREIMKVLPGKMAEVSEVEKKENAVWKRLGLNPVVTRYTPWAREGDRMHTLVYQAEFDSLATIEANMGKVGADPEMREVGANWDEIVESHVVEFYMVEDY